MKTYKIELSNEPLREGCLTQYGTLKDTLFHSSTNYFETEDLKHLKCYEINHITYPVRGRTCRKIEITDPSELQRIWEERKGAEPKMYLQCSRCRGRHYSDCSVCYGSGNVINEKYYDALNEWQNFTLEPGTYQVDPTEEEVKDIIARTNGFNNWDDAVNQERKEFQKLNDKIFLDMKYKDYPERLKEFVEERLTEKAKVLERDNHDYNVAIEEWKEVARKQRESEPLPCPVHITGDNINVRMEEGAMKIERKVLPDNNFEELLQKELDKLPYKHGDDGMYNDGKLDGFELGARWAKGLPDNNGWISVEDKPLFTVDENGHWLCTEDGEGDFMAAVPYYDNKKNKDLWWIRHCVIEEETGLCIVGDDYNEPAGWSLEHVTHWQPLPQPPRP